MTKRTIVCKIALLCSAPVILLSQKHDTGSITGNALNSSNGEPVAGAKIIAFPAADPSGGAFPSATSQADGSFQLQGVPAGIYVVRGRKSGFATAAGEDRGTTVTVEPGESSDGVQIALIPCGQIRGTVINESGLPMGGVRVQAFFLNPVFVPARLWPTEVHSTTDKSGHYLLAKLDPGTYYVMAVPNSSTRQPPDDFQPIPTFFPESPSALDGFPIFVQPSETATADIRIRTAPTHRIEGKIADLDRELSDRHLHLEISCTGIRQAIAVRPDRSFLATGVPSGQYDLRLFGNSEGRSVLLSRQQVSVGASDLTGVIILPMRRIDFTVLVQRDQTSPDPIGPVGIRLEPRVEGTWGTSYGQAVGANGAATFRGIEPNRYLVEVLPSRPDLYVSSLTLDNRDVLNEYVDLSECAGAQLRATLRSGTGAITGSVKEGASMVILAAVPVSPDGSNVRFQHMQKDGEFEFRNVHPGDYLMYAAENGNVQIWLQPSFLQAMHDLGTPVHLDESGLQNLTISVIQRRILHDRAMLAGFYFE